MPESFSDILSERLHAERRPALVVRTLAQADVEITEVRSEHPTFERSDPLPYDDAFAVALQIRDFPRHEWWEDGRLAPITALRAGDMTIYDLRRDPRFLINNPFHSIHVHLPRPLIASLAHESGRGDMTELLYQSGIGIDDPVFRNLIRLLQPALNDPAVATRLFVDAVTLAIASHVVSSYGVAVRRRTQRRPALSKRQQNVALAMIEANLRGELRVADLAREAGLSASHFAYAFKQTLGVAPHGWLAQRRIERAKALLRTDDMSLAQIALACGFADQSHFTRQFTARVGRPPGAWRRNATRDPSHP